MIFLDVSLFLGLGILFWYLSYKIPIKSYKTRPVDFFDKWYAFVIVIFVILIKTIILIDISEFLISAIPFLNQIQKLVAEQELIIRFFLFFIVADFGYYWVHRFLHSPMGWRFHSMHHGIESLNWISGVRGSPIHVFFILSPVVFSQVLFLSNDSYWYLIGFSVFDIANQHFTHSNVRFLFEKEIEYFLITPRMHFVHHNPEERYTNSNYGSYLSIWDRMFGTYVNESEIYGSAKGKVGLDYKESMISGFFCLDKRKYPAEKNKKS